jgi:hypothetical protein
VRCHHRPIAPSRARSRRRADEINPIHNQPPNDRKITAAPRRLDPHARASGAKIRTTRASACDSRVDGVDDGARAAICGANRDARRITSRTLTPPM